MAFADKLRELFGKRFPDAVRRPPVGFVSEDDLRKCVVECALGEIGNDDPSKYWEEAAGISPSRAGAVPAAWCGVFALWCLRKVLLTDVLWKFGAGFVYQAGLRQIRVTAAQPGDIAYFNRAQHHAVVVGVLPDETALELVNGNSGGSGLANGRVSRSVKKMDRVTAVFSISPLVAKVEREIRNA